MRILTSSPVQPVQLGEALRISLDNYYDLLKEQIGGLNTLEFLQLKLVADGLDVSQEKYPWYSYHNLLTRSDLSIDPEPVEGAVMTAATPLSEVYGKFLNRLRRYAVSKTLTSAQQLEVEKHDLEIQRLKTLNRQLAREDMLNWQWWAEVRGIPRGDLAAYVQWSTSNGEIRNIEANNRAMRDLLFKKQTVLNTQYPEADDRAIVDAEFEYDNPTMRLRYPIHPDYEYAGGENFSLEYLATLPPGNSALFDDRRVVTWNKGLDAIASTSSGHFETSFDRNTTASSSVTTDWSYSGSASYAFVRVKASASEHKQISEEFGKTTKIDLSAAAAFRLNINWPAWFKPSLFGHRRVVENIYDFEEYFGANGTLLYHPTALIFVRGFKAAFSSQRDWSYDYQRRFSASGGGGFNIAGINFGSSGSYSKQQKEHQVDSSGTRLTIEDDASTLRFVGYAVKKTDVYATTREALQRRVFGR